MAIPAISLAITAASAYASHKSRQRSAKFQKEQAEQSNMLADVENRRNRVKAIREARIKRAQIVAQGESVGAQLSSGVAGGVSSVASQLGSNIGFQNYQTGVSKNIAGIGNQAIQSQNRGDLYQSIGGIGQTIFSAYSGPTT
jgi:hypothetical protein